MEQFSAEHNCRNTNKLYVPPDKRYHKGNFLLYERKRDVSFYSVALSRP